MLFSQISVTNTVNPSRKRTVIIDEKLIENNVKWHDLKNPDLHVFKVK